MRSVDVIIVGLGPTGATLAALLAQRGVEVVAFDRLPDLYPLPRAIGFDHEVMRVMQELGITKEVLENAEPYRPSEYLGVAGQLIKRLDMAPEPHPLGWAPNYVFNQPAVERAIRARLSQFPNAEQCLSAEVTSVDEHPNGVDVAVNWANGKSAKYTARYLVACDGGASPTRKRLGISLQDLDFDEPWLVVDAIVSDEALKRLPQTQVQYCEPARPCTYVVGPGNHRRWELMILPEDAVREKYTDDDLWPLLERWIKPGEATLWRAASYRFHGLVAKSWRKGRVLLAGDSAHMTPPFMAQGMVAGIRDAQNLAWKLERVLKGYSSEKLLETYGEERRPHAEKTIRAAIELGRVICERDATLASTRDTDLLAAQGGVVKTTVRQTMLPQLESGLLAPQTTRAGELFLQPRVHTANIRAELLDELTGSTWRLVTTCTLERDESTEFVNRMRALGGRLVCLVDVLPEDCDTSHLCVVEHGSMLRQWFEDAKVSFAVVRPDHYVYGTACSAKDALTLLQVLAEQLS